MRAIEVDCPNCHRVTGQRCRAPVGQRDPSIMPGTVSDWRFFCEARISFAAAETAARRRSTMNITERAAWRMLIDMGARTTEISGKATLDLTPIRATSRKKLRDLLHAFLEVAGRSGCNRRHVDRGGRPVFVVTDDPTPPTLRATRIRIPRKERT